MSYDEGLAERIRDEVRGKADVAERKMFGGLGFTVEDRIAVAAGSGGDLIVRVDPASAPDWVDGVAVRPMVMRNRPLRGWLLVANDALTDDETLATWVDRGVSYARSLPPKSR